MDGACGTYGGEERCIQNFGGEILRERDNLEDLGVDLDDNNKVNLRNMI
jgi:hypothetical protein